MGRIFTDGGAVVAFYAALNALIIFALAANTIRLRVKTRTPLGDAGNTDMLQAIRAHANAVEYAPITLILMGGLAALGAGLGLLHVLGAGLTFSRLFHAAGLLKSSGPNLERQAGMMLGFTTLVLGALTALFMSVAG